MEKKIAYAVYYTSTLENRQILLRGVGKPPDVVELDFKNFHKGNFCILKAVQDW